MYQLILDFWFDKHSQVQWWSASISFDDEIRRRFGELLESAAHGEVFAWRSTAKGRLAEIIVLDQFSRNIFRNTARAFSQDPMALVLAQEAVAAKAHLDLSGDERVFLLMPFMHSESRAIHGEAEKLFREYAPEANVEFELRHKSIIDRFGRYPHRNRILGRESTADEIEFLKQPESSF